MTNRISIIGNINKEGITIDEQKGIAKFSIAVSQSKDEEAQWYNLTYFLNKNGEDKTLDTIKNIQSLEKSPQVKIDGYLSYNNVEKQNDYGKKEIKTYTNLIANNLTINDQFELPKAKVKLKGTIHKSLEDKESVAIDENGSESKKGYSHFTLKTADKNGEYEKFHFITSTNIDKIDILSKGKIGDSIEVEGRLSPKGSIKITKECPIEINGKKIIQKDKENDR